MTRELCGLCRRAVGLVVVSGDHALGRGRKSYELREWSEAYGSLSEADGAAPLGAADLELLGRAAYMLGRDDDYIVALERAHRAHLVEGRPHLAVRCAFFIGLNLMPRGEVARATGWFGRAQRLLERELGDCVERGYLLMPVLLGHVANGESEAAYEIACAAADLGDRFGDDDLLALGLMEKGHALVRPYGEQVIDDLTLEEADAFLDAVLS